MSSPDHAPQPPRRWLAYGALAAAVAGIVWSAFFVGWANVPVAGPAAGHDLVGRPARAGAADRPPRRAVAGEPIAMPQIFGGLLVLAGMIVVNRLAGADWIATYLCRVGRRPSPGGMLVPCIPFIASPGG
jgi:hypothetical protein